MVITKESNKSDWMWLWCILIDNFNRNPYGYRTYEYAVEKMEVELGVTTEPRNMQYGVREFKVVDMDKFMMEKLKR